MILKATDPILLIQSRSVCHWFLFIQKIETMAIKTFGIESQNQQVCEVVKTGINLRDGNGL